MEKDEKLILILPGDKVIIKTNRPVKFYYRAVDVEDAGCIYEVVL